MIFDWPPQLGWGGPLISSPPIRRVSLDGGLEARSRSTLAGMPSSKWMVQTLITVAGTIVVVAAQIQADGVELTGIAAMVTAAAAGVLAYFKAENRPPPSARAAIQAGK